MTIEEMFLLAFVMVAIPLVLIGAPIFVFTGGMQSFALRPLERCFGGLKLHETPQPGDVSCVYHSYRGFLLWFVQTEHHIHAPPADALKALRRLRLFNLTWGLLSYGLLFVPLLAIGNYYVQERSILRQTAAQRDEQGANEKS